MYRRMSEEVTPLFVQQFEVSRPWHHSAPCDYILVWSVTWISQSLNIDVISHFNHSVHCMFRNIDVIRHLKSSVHLVVSYIDVKLHLNQSVQFCSGILKYDST